MGWLEKEEERKRTQAPPAPTRPSGPPAVEPSAIKKVIWTYYGVMIGMALAMVVVVLGALAAAGVASIYAPAGAAIGFVLILPAVIIFLILLYVWSKMRPRIARLKTSIAMFTTEAKLLRFLLFVATPFVHQEGEYTFSLPDQAATIYKNAYLAAVVFCLVMVMLGVWFQFFAGTLGAVFGEAAVGALSRATGTLLVTGVVGLIIILLGVPYPTGNTLDLTSAPLCDLLVRFFKWLFGY